MPCSTPFNTKRSTAPAKIKIFKDQFASVILMFLFSVDSIAAFIYIAFEVLARLHSNKHSVYQSFLVSADFAKF